MYSQTFQKIQETVDLGITCADDFYHVGSLTIEMTEPGHIVKELKKTPKGKLTYNRESNLQDIYNEIQQLICLSVQPFKCAGYEEKKEEVTDVNCSTENEKVKIDSTQTSNQITDYNFAYRYAEAIQEIIRYEVERKEDIKKKVADKKRTWEKYEQKLHNECKDKTELLKKNDLDKKNESFEQNIHKICEEKEFDNKNENSDNCIQVTEEMCHTQTGIAEKEYELRIEDIQKETFVANRNDKRYQFSRKDLEEAYNEINSNLAMIIHRIQSYPQYRTQENDNAIQFLKKANENMQCMFDDNKEILHSDIETAMSYLSLTKQMLQTLPDIAVEMDFVASNDFDSRQNLAIKAISHEQKKFEEFPAIKDFLPNNTSNSEKGISIAPSFKSFSANTYSSTVPINTTISQISHVPASAITINTSIDHVDKVTILQSNPSVQSASLLPHLNLQSQPELESQEKIDEVEEMDSGPLQVDNYDENVLNEYVPREALKKYLLLQTFLQKWKECYEAAISIPEWKKKKLDLQKAINTPINSMSALSGAHLKDKIERLSEFLSGKNVEVAGKKVSINIAPQAKHFCMDFLAKKLVSQGETQVSSCHEDAFPLAATTVHLWQQHPDLGMLFMAHMYEKCPYLVPFYIPRQEDQTKEEHYKALGYIYTDGTVEKQDVFLKRMSGIVRLYAAVLQTRPILKQPHPHGIGNGWTWMARVMNLEPYPDITATILFDFLQVCGNTMQKAYGKQFHKLLLTLAMEYIPKIKKVSSGGPLRRLENFIEESLKKGHISQPVGMITDNFWKTL